MKRTEDERSSGLRPPPVVLVSSPAWMGTSACQRLRQPTGYRHKDMSRRERAQDGTKPQGQGAPLGQSQGTRPCWEEGKGTLWGSPDSEQDRALAQPLCRVLPVSGSCPKMERAGPPGRSSLLFSRRRASLGMVLRRSGNSDPSVGLLPKPTPVASCHSAFQTDRGGRMHGRGSGHRPLPPEGTVELPPPTPPPALSAAQMDLSRPSSGLRPRHLSSLTSIPLATHLTLP